MAGNRAHSYTRINEVPNTYKFLILDSKLRDSGQHVTYIQSPIGLVPKGKNDTRLIFHLSYPRGEKKLSVNACTPRELCSVRYNDFEEAARMCWKAGPGCFVAKSDMNSACCNLPIRPEDWKWLVMMAPHPVTKMKCYFFDKCLPFGAGISCSHFQRFSNCVAHLVKWKTGKKTHNYLDDFFFVQLLKALCDGQVEKFIGICREINFHVSMEKTFWGHTVIIYLGILINTVSQTISIPIEKIEKALDMLQEITTAKRTAVLRMQQLTGLLNFMSKAIIPGCAFT